MADEESIIGKIKEKADKAWSGIRRMAGQCAANTTVEDLKDACATGRSRIHYALLGGELLQKDSQVFDKLTQANKALGDIAQSLETVQDVCLDIVAIGKIQDAVRILNNNPNNDSDVMAKEFGNLFVGFGRLCRHLPPPGKQWGQFLEHAGDFFSNMANKLIPQKRWRKQFDQIEGMQDL